MINLFHIPNYIVDENKFSHPLQGGIVREFEEKFAEYVGAKYAVSFHSATNAILLMAKLFKCPDVFYIPSIIPPVVPNAIITGGKSLEFVDMVKWVGDSYFMNERHHTNLEDSFNIIDSAQAVRKNQFSNEHINPHDLMLFSFYPTKPVGGRDGGMIVSNEKSKIELLRMLSNNGMNYSKNSWERVPIMAGYKLYMSSYQAFIANKNLKKLDNKKEKLAVVRDFYNKKFGLGNTSEHLYRVLVEDNQAVVQKAAQKGIVCGIHYTAAHRNPLYYDEQMSSLPRSDYMSGRTLSIPFHEKLTKKEMQTVADFIQDHLIS